MTISLPAAIAAYFDANSRLDVDSMLAPFAEDALVTDEGRAIRGREAIRAWIVSASVGNKAVARPRSCVADGVDRIVTAEVAGEFRGSPVTLGFRFALDGDRIVRLEIR